MPSKSRGSGAYTPRKPEDIPTLWGVFRLAQGETPFDDDQFAKAFDTALQVRVVNVNLTMGLFWIRPERFLSLDSANRAYLKIILPAGGLSFAFYRDTVRAVTTRGVSVPDLSHRAWLAATSTEPVVSATQQSSESLVQPGFWLVGAYWNGNDPPDQTERFCAEGIWENGYEDRYLDEVKLIAVGDRIAIKSAHTPKNRAPFRLCWPNSFLHGHQGCWDCCKKSR